MTNEQLVLKEGRKIEALKKQYINIIEPLAVNYKVNNVLPSVSQLINCQREGNAYFNHVEVFVGNSGLLGAHANGKWVTGFAETCHAVLVTYVFHIIFLRSHSATLGASYQEPDSQAYANMQRMVKEYLEKDTWKKLKKHIKKITCLYQVLNILELRIC